MIFLILIPLFPLSVAIMVLLVRLQKYRIDVPPGASFADGRSPVWQVNAFSRANYRPEAQRSLLWLKLCLLTLLIGAGIFVMGVAILDPPL